MIKKPLQVPVLAWEEDGELLSVYESLICNEFLEVSFSVGSAPTQVSEWTVQEYAPPPEAPAMLPPNPAARASCRIIMDR